MACTSESISLRILREPAPRPTIPARLMNAWYAVERWRERARQRRALLMMDDRMLRDIGISRADADYIARKSFWRS